MDRDDILRMARESGYKHPDAVGDAEDFAYFDFERFAALVAAAKELKMIEEGWRQCAIGQRTTQFCGQVEQAVAAEREACAEICDEFASNAAEGQDFHALDACESCGEAIRARGQG